MGLAMSKHIAGHVSWAAIGSLLVLSACNGVGFSTSASNSFAATYFQARTALEAGNFDTAASRYDAMLANAGPLETRLRLEKAHALLRADRYASAAQEARAVAASHTDDRRAAALAVVGTAEHRMAQEAMTKGDFGAVTIGHLGRARAALTEMLQTAPELDPLGAMAQRLTMIDASLKNLGT